MTVKEVTEAQVREACDVLSRARNEGLVIGYAVFTIEDLEGRTGWEEGRWLSNCLSEYGVGLIHQETEECDDCTDEMTCNHCDRKANPEDYADFTEKELVINGLWQGFGGGLDGEVKA